MVWIAPSVYWKLNAEGNSLRSKPNEKCLVKTVLVSTRAPVIKTKLSPMPCISASPLIFAPAAVGRHSKKILSRCRNLILNFSVSRTRKCILYSFPTSSILRQQYETKEGRVTIGNIQSPSYQCLLHSISHRLSPIRTLSPHHLLLPEWPSSAFPEYQPQQSSPNFWKCLSFLSQYAISWSQKTRHKSHLFKIFLTFLPLSWWWRWCNGQ